MAEAAINLGFLAATTYVIGRDVYGRLPSLPTTSGKRFRGEPSATPMDDEVCDPAALPTRHGSSGLPRRQARAVKACCESLLELKCSYSTASGAVPSSGAGGRVTTCNDLSQGTGVGNRVGNKIINKELVISGYINLPANKDVDIFRLIAVVDTDCFGSAPTLANYFQGGTTSVFEIPSHETVGRNKRFAILADHMVPISNTTTTGAGGVGVLKTFSFKIPLNCSTHYSGNAGTVSDITKNGIFILECSLNANVNVDYSARLCFLDG